MRALGGTQPIDDPSAIVAVRPGKWAFLLLACAYWQTGYDALNRRECRALGLQRADHASRLAGGALQSAEFDEGLIPAPGVVRGHQLLGVGNQLTVREGLLWHVGSGDQPVDHSLHVRVEKRYRLFEGEAGDCP